MNGNIYSTLKSVIKYLITNKCTKLLLELMNLLSFTNKISIVILLTLAILVYIKERFKSIRNSKIKFIKCDLLFPNRKYNPNEKLVICDKKTNINMMIMTKLTQLQNKFKSKEHYMMNTKNSRDKQFFKLIYSYVNKIQ